MRVRAAGGALILASALAGAPAAGDWLLMKDGSRVETKGGWETRGAQIVFTLPNGTFAAVRASAVDLDGSARLTAEALAPKPEPTPTPQPKAPVLRLTDADVGHVEATSSASGAPGASAPNGEKPATRAKGEDLGLRVSTWDVRYDVGAAGTVLTGVLVNGSGAVAYDIEITVTALDGQGTEVGNATATLASSGIAANASGSFEARFPGVVELRDARFEITAERAALDSDPEPAPNAPPPGGSPTSGVGAVESAQRLQVAHWSTDPASTSAGTSLVGELTNRSQEVAYDVGLSATLIGDDGATIGSANALLGSSALQPGETTSFRVSFPGVTAYQDVRFEARHQVRTAVRPTVPARPAGGR